jgi:hypothetical protein
LELKWLSKISREMHRRAGARQPVHSE